MGHFIFKFLRELNSTTSNKMMVLAIVLGLIAGFLPFVNFFTVLIFIVVLIFRIPIGLFLASFSFFEFIGYLFDPLFNKTGLFLLKASFLKPLWTFFYNLPFFRWSGFNNTIVMGSLFWGVVFGIVLYFILIKLVALYRSKVFEKLKTKKYLSWLVPNEKKGIIRITGIGFIGALIAIVALFFMFLLDPIVKYSLEFSLSKVLHKKVAIEKVDTNIKNLSLNIKNMQIGDVLFKKVYTKLDWDKLIWRKYKIDDLEFIANTNKNIYQFIKSHQKQNSLKSISKKLPLKLPNPKEFLASQNLKSIQAIKKLQKDYKKVQKDLKSLSIDKYKKEFNNLKRKLEGFNNVKINSPADLQNLISNINLIKKEADDLLKKIKKDKKFLLSDKKLIENDIKNVKISLKEDEENIKSKYEMIKNKEYLKFVESFLKPEIAKYVDVANRYYKKLKPYLAKKENKKEYIRKKGIYIKFEDKVHYPDFVLIRGFGEVKTPIAKWNLKIKNISDNQVLLNKEAVLNIKGFGKFFDVGANISYLKKINFRAYGNKIKLKNIDINLAKMNALLDLKAKGVIDNQEINAKIYAYFQNVVLNDLKKNIQKILGNSIEKIKKFKIVININGNFSSPKISINSDLDKIFAKIINQKINSIINKQILKTNKLLNSQINNSLKGLNLNILDTKLNELNSMENIKNLIDKKAIGLIKSKESNSIGNVIKKLLPF